MSNLTTRSELDKLRDNINSIINRLNDQSEIDFYQIPTNKNFVQKLVSQYVRDSSGQVDWNRIPRLNSEDIDSILNTMHKYYDRKQQQISAEELNTLNQETPGINLTTFKTYTAGKKMSKSKRSKSKLKKKRNNTKRSKKSKLNKSTSKSKRKSLRGG
jgi:hypothetical protein